MNRIFLSLDRELVVVLGKGPGPNGFAYDVADGLWAHQVAGYSAEGSFSQLLVPGPDLLLMVGGEDRNVANSHNVLKRRALRLARDEDDGNNFEFEMVMYQEARRRRKFLFYNEKCWACCRL